MKMSTLIMLKSVFSVTLVMSIILVKVRHVSGEGGSKFSTLKLQHSLSVCVSQKYRIYLLTKKHYPCKYLALQPKVLRLVLVIL